VLTDGKSYRGHLQMVSDDALVLRLARGEQTFERESIPWVSTRGESRRRRTAPIGLAVGAAAGVTVAVASPELGTGKCVRRPCVDAGIIPMLGFWGGVVSAGLGALIPTRG